MASLTRAQQRELIEKTRRAIRPSPHAATESVEAFMGEITAVCDGYTQALTDLDEADRNLEMMVRTAMKAGRALEKTHQELTVIDREAWKQALDEAANAVIDELRTDLEAAEQRERALREALAPILAAHQLKAERCNFQGCGCELCVAVTPCPFALPTPSAPPQGRIALDDTTRAWVQQLRETYRTRGGTLTEWHDGDVVRLCDLVLGDR